MSIPRDHHYVPQFYLRNFAVDPDQKKITTVAKHGSRAVWSKRSIENLGFERDLYVSLRGGIPISVETIINKRIETPISKSDTWGKIASGKTETLDRSDKAILYAFIRHLEVRTPHFLATTMELARMAGSDDSSISFSNEEREHYAYLRAHPNEAKTMFNLMSLSTKWTEENFRGAGLSIFRSPIPLRTSSVPVMAVGAPMHPALHLPLPDQTPYQLLLALNKRTLASLVLGDFDDGFVNVEIGEDVAHGFNRHYVGQFAHFDHVRHLVTDRDDLATDMTWAPYSLVEENERRITFHRNA